MNDLEYIKKFSKITISGVCRKININRSSLLMGKLKPEQIKEAREELEHEIAKLYIKEEIKNGK